MLYVIKCIIIKFRVFPYTKTDSSQMEIHFSIDTVLVYNPIFFFFIYNYIYTIFDIKPKRQNTF